MLCQISLVSAKGVSGYGHPVSVAAIGSAYVFCSLVIDVCCQTKLNTPILIGIILLSHLVMFRHCY